MMLSIVSRRFETPRRAFRELREMSSREPEIWARCAESSQHLTAVESVEISFG
jgi:hypothetical protein